MLKDIFKKIGLYLLLFVGLSQQLSAKNITVYLDYATLPALNTLLDFAQNKDDRSTVRIFGLSRFPLSQEIVDQYPAGVIKVAKMKRNDQTDFDQLLFKEIEDSKETVNLTIYANLTWAAKMLSPLAAYMHTHPNKVKIKHLYLYDDGSGDYLALYQNRNKNIQQELEQAEKLLPYLLVAKEKEFSAEQFNLPAFYRYVWHKSVPTTYIMLRPDYLTKDPLMQPLKTYLGDRIEQMDWTKYQHLTAEQQQFFLQLVGFTPEIKHSLETKQKKFVFTGTTTWLGDSKDREYYAKAQTNILNNFIQPNGALYIGEGYQNYFKGHPRGLDINDYILAHTKELINISANIPFELLIMTDLLPEKVGGMVSSLYFSLPEKNISHLIFTTSKEVKTALDAFNTDLLKMMLLLEIVKPEQVVFWDQLPQLPQ
ncbi:sialyltransferase [Mergibacter septicus]|uniref:sialyltransferase n=1 Tax=Mergibacter septicus TaxID=221402 RepID=UPI001C74F488|nr:sialyltransferase [Mergibacter septicus]QDJ12677.1 sialyltransferase [Mergibacter septicus]